MKHFLSTSALLLALVVAPLARANDIFISFSDFGDGGAAANTTSTVLQEDISSTQRGFIWVRNGLPIDTGVSLDIINSNPAAVALVGGSALNFNIVLPGTTLEFDRWAETPTPENVTPEQITNMLSVGMFGGAMGIDPANDGSGSLVDEGFDPASDAFLFGFFDFEVIGEGTADFSLAIGSGLIVHDNMALTPEFAGATVNVVPEPAAASVLAIGLLGLAARRRS